LSDEPSFGFAFAVGSLGGRTGRVAPSCRRIWIAEGL
jgi:hypothetical protein